MNANLIIVTGYFGAPVRDKALELARQRDLPLVDLDKEIEQRDGRSIRRLVMMNGEHGYRNAEFKILSELAAADSPCVVACGDGVLYDDDSRELARANELVVVGEDMPADKLWDNAKADEGTYHAFMSFGSEEEKHRAFEQFIQRQRTLFASL